jgi:hypothetical protein
LTNKWNDELEVGFVMFSRLRMHLSKYQPVKLFRTVPANVGKTIVRTMFNPFGSKSIETAKDAHSNLLTSTENVFELQHHIVRPKAMVNQRTHEH